STPGARSLTKYSNSCFVSDIVVRRALFVWLRPTRKLASHSSVLFHVINFQGALTGGARIFLRAHLRHPRPFLRNRTNLGEGLLTSSLLLFSCRRSEVQSLSRGCSNTRSRPVTPATFTD